MILGFDDIHLDRLLGGLTGLVDLHVLPSEPSPFEHHAGQAAIAQAVVQFREYVYDNCDREGELRRALAWLLNQDDAGLARVIAGAGTILSTPRVDVHRRFYETLWDGVFASWRIEDPHPEEDLVVVGL